MNQQAPTNRNKLRRWALMGIVLVLCAVLLAAWLRSLGAGAVNPLEPPGMAAARYSPGDMVGDLGGMPVTIPRHFANFVEYDGDPGFGEKRKGPKPERTHQSRLRSFGFKLRYPDMAGLSSPELEKDRAGYTIFNTQWIDVGITTGSYFGDGLFLERQSAGINSRNLKFQFEKQVGQQYGMEVYSPVGIDPATKKPGGYTDFNDQDHFLHRDEQGRVDALIECSNVTHAAAPCKHFFFLPSPLRAKSTVGYRRGLLPEWQQIQSSTTALVLGFKAPQSQTPNQ